MRNNIMTYLLGVTFSLARIKKYNELYIVRFLEDNLQVFEIRIKLLECIICCVLMIFCLYISSFRKGQTSGLVSSLVNIIRVGKVRVGLMNSQS